VRGQTKVLNCLIESVYGVRAGAGTNCNLSSRARGVSMIFFLLVESIGIGTQWMRWTLVCARSEEQGAGPIGSGSCTRLDSLTRLELDSIGFILTDLAG
jgi:hypothetical protein